MLGDFRLEQLSQWIHSKPILSLASGHLPHKAFWYRCAKVYKLAAMGDQVPGPPLVDLWECGDSITACRMNQGVLEFVEFNVEHPEDIEVIATSEQGLLAHVFIELSEDEDDDQLLRDAAASVGYRWLEETLRFQSQNGGDPEYRRKLREFVLSIS